MQIHDKSMSARAETLSALQQNSMAEHINSVLFAGDSRRWVYVISERGLALFKADVDTMPLMAGGFELLAPAMEQSG
jgi:hypothetical protein